MDGGAWKAAVPGVAKGRARLSDFTFTFHFHALEKEMTIHSRVLAWRIPGTGEPGGLPSMGSHRVGHEWRDLAAAAAAAGAPNQHRPWWISWLRAPSCGQGEYGFQLWKATYLHLDLNLSLPMWGFPCGSAGKEKIRLQYGGPGFDPWVGKIPWRK